MLRHAGRDLVATRLLRLGGLRRLVELGAGRVALSYERVELRSKLRELIFEASNDDVIVLHGQQSANIRVHESSNER